VEPDPPVDSLVRLGLADESEPAAWTALTGGVSSDIWRVDLDGRSVCVKRARPVLAVAAEWLAPVERNEAEVAWLKVVAGIDSRVVPRVLGDLADEHLFVMEHLEPACHRVWKTDLAAGDIDISFAGAVGARLGAIHARTARRADLAVRFATDDLFDALRLDPYLGATAIAHPDRAERLDALRERTAARRLALVHGDVSPKNILAGPDGPVLLDAECAWFGDPAFDPAFCLTHLLLKALWVPGTRRALRDSFDAFCAAYFGCVDWEPLGDLEARVATLIPALLLARVDGKSPVEYLTEADRDRVRRVSREMLVHPSDSVVEVGNAWHRSIAS
jgi:aminoglycoside phosphotransferase (APT) family kinase protein